MARPRKRSSPTPPAPEAAAAGNGAEQLLGPVALASPDPAATDWIPMWGPTPNTLPQDTVIAAATRIIANRLVNTDANAAWQVRGDGRMDWGAGGGAAYDTNLYRSAAGMLKTDGGIITKGQAGYIPGLKVDGVPAGQHAIQVMKTAGDTQPTLAVDSAGGLFWGPGGSTGVDAGFFRPFADALRTNNYFSITRPSVSTAFGVLQQSDTQLRLGLDSAGVLTWGSGSATADVNLYRVQANVLQTNGYFYANGQIKANVGGAQVAIGDVFGNNQPGISCSQGGGISNYYQPLSGNNIFYVYAGGYGQINAAAFSVQSDRATKSDEKPAKIDVEKLLSAGIYTYRRDDTKERHLGVMADELPDDVVTVGPHPEAGKGTHQFVDIYKLTTALLATVQHLNERIKVLEVA